MKNFVRDSGVNIAVRFMANDGTPAPVTAANVTLSYVAKGGCQRTFLTYPMLPPVPPLGNLLPTGWTYVWDSSVSEPCVVECTATTETPGQPVAAVDFSFRLTANRANKELAGDELPYDPYV
jgi:hypothetical protein